jgi:hypothetical protein
MKKIILRNREAGDPALLQKILLTYSATSIIMSELE